MNRSEKEGINTVSANVTRSTSEPEDIDLAAAATAGAPAKTLETNPAQMRARPGQAGQPAPRSAGDQQETEASNVPPTKNPRTVAGSINPRQKTAFYEAVVRSSNKRKLH